MQTRKHIYQAIRALTDAQRQGHWASSVVKNDSIKLAAGDYKVTIKTPKTLRLKKGDVPYTFAIRGSYISARSAAVETLLRDFAGTLEIDLINEHNPFHTPSDIFTLTQKALTQTTCAT